MKTKNNWTAVRLGRTPRAGHSRQTTCTWLIAAALLLAARPLRAAGLEADGGVPGPYPVGHTSFVSATDFGRAVAVDVYYPADPRFISNRSREARYALDLTDPTLGYSTSSQWERLGYDRAFESPRAAEGPFPLVMFGTALGMPAWGYLYIGTRLASHGSVVAVVQGFREGFWDDQEWDDNPYLWFFYRPREFSFALDEMLRRDREPGHLLHRAIDHRFIVAAGHSLGGYAALVQLAGDDQLCDANEFRWWGDFVPLDGTCVPTRADHRFTALITLDGPQEFLRWEELSRISVPSLIMGQASWADEDNALPDAPYWTYLARPHAAISAHQRAARVDVKQVDHISFANGGDGITLFRNARLISRQEAEDHSWMYPGVDSGKITLPPREAQRITTKYLVAFLKAEVTSERSGMSRQILTQAYTIANEPNAEIYWHENRPPGTPLPRGTFTYFIDMVPGTWAVGEKNPAGFFIPYP